MCSAEVLVFAEALRRRPVGARPSGPAGVCRRLFAGDAERPGRIARDAEAELRRQVAARWNFDFERGAPLPGRFQWVPVGATQREPTVHEVRPQREPTVHEVRPQREPTVDEVRPHRKPSTPKGKRSAGADLANQHKITDFMPKKKRPHSDDVSSPHKLKLRRLSGDRAPTAAGPT